MKKVIYYFIIVIGLYFIFPIENVNAQRGCCSWHDGVSGKCSSSGKQICNDGTESPSCTCTPEVVKIYGCMDVTAKNYNPKATISNSTCKYYTYGCTDKGALNYNSKADKDNGTCNMPVTGCMDSKSINYNASANVSSNACQYQKIKGETVKIKYKTIYKNDKKLKKGKQKVESNGKDGTKKIQYKIIIDQNNIEISKTIISEKIIKKPINKIIRKGTKK